MHIIYIWLVKKLIAHVGGNKIAIIVLHEIYGINNFILDICRQYYTEGYDVYCPNLLSSEKAFPYSEVEEAYNFFINMVSFEVYKEINNFAYDLKKTYSKIFIIGFSVGATIAWKCSEQILYDGIICCYGSRIRDYLSTNPKCSVLLVFAKYDSFDVPKTIMQLQCKKNIVLEILDANHGFVDSYSKNYSYSETEMFNKLRKAFLNNYTK